MSTHKPPFTTATLHYADNPLAFPMEGGCCCGYIRYRLERDPMAVHCCHCTSCQRETGSAFGINVIIEATNLTLLPPAPAAVPAHPGAPDTFPRAGPSAPSPSKQELIRAQIPQESGEAQNVTHCPKCFIAVWTEYSCGPAIKFVRQGTLDRAWLLQPDLHLYVRSKREFVTIADVTVQFQEFYDRTKVWRPESLERWDRVMPEIKKYRESLDKAETE